MVSYEKKAVMTNWCMGKKNESPYQSLLHVLPECHPVTVLLGLLYYSLLYYEWFVLITNRRSDDCVAVPFPAERDS